MKILWLGWALCWGALGAGAQEGVRLPVGEEWPVASEGVFRALVVAPHIATAEWRGGQLYLKALRLGRTQVFLWTAEGKREVEVLVVAGSSSGGGEGPRDAWQDPPHRVSWEVRIEAHPQQTLPQSEVSFTVKVRSLTASPPSSGRVRCWLSPGLEVLETEPQGVYQQDLHAVEWSATFLGEGREQSFLCKAKVKGTGPQGKVSAWASVAGEGGDTAETLPVEVEVKNVALMAVFALPDIIVGRRELPLPFPDIASESLLRTVDRLAGLGVVHGYPDYTFRPHGEVKRAEAVKMLMLVAALEGLRDRTQIAFALAEPAWVTVEIYDSKNQRVRLLLEKERREAGSHAVAWDGTDDTGLSVEPGVYEYRVTAVQQDGVTASLASAVNVVSLRPFTSSGKSPFRDVEEGRWYYQYVAAAAQRGWIRGYPDGTFRPTAPMRRVEETVLVVRAAGLEEEAQRRADATLGFEDDAEIPAWARGYVAVATTTGPRAEGKLLLGDSQNRFLPQRPLTRSEAALFMERFLDRDTRRTLTISGVVSYGTRLAINGRTLTDGREGRFREEVTLLPEMNMVSVSVVR